MYCLFPKDKIVYAFFLLLLLIHYIHMIIFLWTTLRTEARIIRNDRLARCFK